MVTSMIQSQNDTLWHTVRAWESVAEAGLKLQAEYGKWIRQMAQETASVNFWKDKTRGIVDETIAKAQESVNDAIGVMQKQVESSVELMQKAVAAHQGTSQGDVAGKCSDWWEAALEAMRSNSRAMINANSRVLSSWSDLAKAVSGDFVHATAHLMEESAAQAEKATKAATDRARELAAHASGNGG